jgi:hypothetical protein
MYLIWQTRTLISKQPRNILKYEVTKHIHALNVRSHTHGMCYVGCRKSCRVPILRTSSLHPCIQRNTITDDQTLVVCSKMHHTHYQLLYIACFFQRYNMGKIVWTNNFAFAYSTDKLWRSPVVITWSCNFAYGSLPINPGFDMVVAPSSLDTCII